MLRRAFLMMIPGMATMLKSENPVVGGTVLRRAAIQSPNFITGSAGWAINQDGTAEFNNAVIRNGQVISGTSLYYNGPAALGNLVASIAAVGGTDIKGNAYIAGVASYQPLAGPPLTAVALSGSVINLYTAPNAGGPWTQVAQISAGSGDLILASNRNIVAQQPLTAPTEVISSGQAGGLLLQVTNTSSPAAPNFRVTGAVAGDPAIATRISGDTFNRVLIDDVSTGGRVSTGPGNLAPDTKLFRAAANLWAADFLAFNAAGAAEVWQTVGGTGAAFANGWVNAAAPGTPLKYKRVCSPDHAVAWVGRIVAPAGVAAGQAITAAVAGVYQPVHTQKVAAINVTTGAAVRLSIGSTGVLTFQSGAAAGDSIDLGDLIYLDA